MRVCGVRVWGVGVAAAPRHGPPGLRYGGEGSFKELVHGRNVLAEVLKLSPEDVQRVLQHPVIVSL